MTSRKRICRTKGRRVLEIESFLNGALCISENSPSRSKMCESSSTGSCSSLERVFHEGSSVLAQTRRRQHGELTSAGRDTTGNSVPVSVSFEFFDMLVERKE